jgi:hypothetical protein
MEWNNANTPIQQSLLNNTQSHLALLIGVPLGMADGKHSGKKLRSQATTVAAEVRGKSSSDVEEDSSDSIC